MLVLPPGPRPVSYTVTAQPPLARRDAAVNPARPPPTTATRTGEEGAEASEVASIEPETWRICRKGSMAGTDPPTLVNALPAPETRTAKRNVDAREDNPSLTACIAGRDGK